MTPVLQSKERALSRTRLNKGSFVAAAQIVGSGSSGPIKVMAETMQTAPEQTKEKLMKTHRVQLGKQQEVEVL